MPHATPAVEAATPVPEAHSACLACGSTAPPQPLYDVLLQCGSCGFAWWNGREGVNPSAIYDDGYFFGGEYLDYPAERSALERNFDIYLSRVREHLPEGRLLEIGCAYGYFLARAQRYYDVLGVDVNAAAVEHARTRLGVEAWCGDVQTMELPTAPFDVVANFAVIEHLARPDRLVERAAALLRPGGIFACVTPDLSSRLARLRGRKWRMIHPPTHVSYFTRPALAALFERCGLTPVHSSSVGQYRTVDNVLYTLCCLHGRAPRAYRLLRRLGLTRGSFYLNTFDTTLAIGVRRA
jgi:SAM-dependent methyltransferase